jgi:uncharacterized protein involved in exopolysaccharide biosynthesis
MSQDHDNGRHPVFVYLEAPVRRPMSLLIPMALVLAAAVAAGLLLPKRYRASALVGVGSAAVSGTPGPREDGGTSDRWLQSARVRMLSRPRLERVAEETHLYPAAGAAAGERLRSAMSVHAVGADSMRVECVHGDPAVAALVANRVATLFVEETEKEHQKGAAQSPDQIDARLAAALQAMEEKEAAVLRFHDRSVGSPSLSAPSTRAALRQLQVERQALTGTLLAAQAEAEALRGAISRGDGEPSREANGPSVELEQLRIQLTALRKRYTDRYPDVQAVLRRIQELEATVAATPEPGPPASASRAELEKKEQEIEALKGRAASIDAEITRLRKAAVPPAGTPDELAVLARDYDQALESYLALMKEWTNARAAPPLWPQRFSILEPAHVPERPFFPSPVAFALAGLAAGFALGVVVACTREFFDHTVKGPEDLEEFLLPPLLATIPHVGSHRDTSRD